MKIKVNPLIIALLPLVVGLVAGYMIPAKKDVGYETELQRQLEVEKKNAAKYSKAYDSLSLQLGSILEEVESARDSLTIESQKSEYYKIRYEKAKTTPVNIVGQHQLDSLLMVRYPFLRHPKAR